MVFNIINNNVPKIAIKKLNLYNNNYNNVKLIPNELSKINDDLIKLLDFI